eukprot:CAMPEP_0206507136 /NCGR_PEP_ID=MMETSP0324_2-20121206/57310_1 /ASSEMBLY_ACC=CAM_ASM_000836 /TAXON_ID=2866 /ORGANISM="Crypthecodinium cohnii, Strain Seligo" /LENGTH=149 /DNA_ID=CAMNT_0053997257 /DNA_START=30 /DNA_END=479 /DNA_ORIENTATION=+
MASDDDDDDGLDLGEDSGSEDGPPTSNGARGTIVRKAATTGSGLKNRSSMGRLFSRKKDNAGTGPSRSRSHNSRMELPVGKSHTTGSSSRASVESGGFDGVRRLFSRVTGKADTPQAVFKEQARRRSSMSDSRTRSSGGDRATLNSLQS